ncbi:stevor PIR protein,putative [Plasmodium sp.]|nr:stevor PIR protein,putative [Plasmodium sp.]
MISYNIKLIFFSIILGILNLIYNNDCDQLYKNINYIRIVELPNNFRILGELSYEFTTNHNHKINELRKYKNTNERKYQKNIYPNNHAKRNHKISKGTKKENNGTINSNKYRKGIYDKEKEAKSNRSSPSIKYLEIQRKLYNDFYVKPGTDFKNFSDKSNDKSCDCQKNSTSDKLTSSNNVNDDYLENFKKDFPEGAGTCGFGSRITSNSGVVIGTAAACVADGAFKAAFGTAEAVAGGKILSAGIKAVVSGGSTLTVGGVAVLCCAFAVIAIIAVLIILYAWLLKRRKNS